MSLVSPKSVAVDEEGLVGRQDSQGDPVAGGVSQPRRDFPDGNPVALANQARVTPG